MFSAVALIFLDSAHFTLGLINIAKPEKSKFPYGEVRQNHRIKALKKVLRRVKNNPECIH